MGPVCWNESRAEVCQIRDTRYGRGEQRRLEKGRAMHEKLMVGCNCNCIVFSMKLFIEFERCPLLEESGSMLTKVLRCAVLRCAVLRCAVAVIL
jgi:hypothetical protein